MNAAALILWLVTAIGGFTMAGIWLAKGGPAQYAQGDSRISPGRLGAHFTLAALGLILWIAHIASDSTPVGWLAFALLPVVAVIGFVMFMTWLAGRGAAVGRATPAEQRIPPLVVVAHGLFAVLTVVAVLVALLS
jgi:hypothetical protein